MWEMDLFDLYRFILAVLVCSYGVVRLIAFVWRWQGELSQAGGPTSRFLRYAGLLLLRLRVRRFAYDLSVVAGLFVVLVLLIRLHRW